MFRYGYHFVVHDQLSRKNVLGGLKGVPPKTVHMVYMEGPQNRFFQFYGGRELKITEKLRNSKIFSFIIKIKIWHGI